MSGKSEHDLRFDIAKTLIVWFDGFSCIHDDLQPSGASWEEFSEKEQKRALKAADAVIELLGKKET